MDKVIKIKEEVQIGKVILEKGDRIQILGESSKDIIPKVDSRMYKKGWDNAQSFAYIPDFKDDQEKADFEAGLKAGYDAKK